MDLDFHQSERPTARRRRQSEDDGSDRIVGRHEVRVNRDAIEGNEGNEGTTTGEVHLDWKSVCECIVRSFVPAALRWRWNFGLHFDCEFAAF
jgi:hypothetical protein